jgi:hypothetical protein
MKLAAFLMSCPERAQVREATLQSLAQSDWNCGVELMIDERNDNKSQRLHNIAAMWRRLVERALGTDADFYLLMEDDLEFNRHLEHNLRCWAPLRARHRGMPFFASLYNPTRAYVWRNDVEHYFVAAPYEVWGAQAVVVSHASADYFLRHWEEVDGPPDLKMPRLSARLGAVFYHVPSLVQHTGTVSTWGGVQHAAHDYDASFCAHAPASRDSSNEVAVW